MLIFDSHAHIIPDLSGPCGYPSVEEHLLVSQKAMHEHLVQPARRTKDNKIIKKLLWDENEDNNDGKFDVNFRVGRYGRFEWNQENEDCYIQYLPTYAEKMEYPVEELKIMMDYAGIHKAVLQCGGVYGNLNDYYLNVIANDKKLSSILYPLIRIDEKEALNVEQQNELKKYINEYNFKGLWFVPIQDCFTKIFDVFWDIVETLNVPIFFPFFPDEYWMQRASVIELFVKKYPNISCVLPQAFPLSVTKYNDKIIVEKHLKNILQSANVLIEIVYPIGRGHIEDYPFPLCREAVKTLYHEFGPQRLVWGSDIPMVERYCTYQQSLKYITDYCEFIPDSDIELIMGKNLETIFN